MSETTDHQRIPTPQSTPNRANPPEMSADIIEGLNSIRDEIALVRQRVERIKVPNPKGVTSRDHREKREPEPPDRYEQRRPYHRYDHEVSHGFPCDSRLTTPTFAGTNNPEDQYGRRIRLDPNDWRRRCKQDDRYYRVEHNDRDKYYHRDREIKHKATAPNQFRPNDAWNRQSGRDKGTNVQGKSSGTVPVPDQKLSPHQRKTDEAFSRLIELLTRPTPNRGQDLDQQWHVPKEAPKEKSSHDLNPGSNERKSVQVTNTPKVSDDLTQFISDPMTVIIHLPCPNMPEKGLGTMPSHMESNTQALPRRTIGQDTKASPKLPKNAYNEWTGLLAPLLIREEPPDAQIRTHPSHNGEVTQGKFLNSHLYQDSNLIYPDAGKEVSRTKPFQRGGYDAAIEPKSSPEAIPTPKDNQGGPSEAETGLEDSGHEVQGRPQPDQAIPTPEEGTFSKLANPDHQAFNRGFRPHQKESSNKKTCSGFLTLQGIWNTLNHPKASSGQKVTPFTTRRFLDAPQFEAHGVLSLQTHTWHPGGLSSHPSVITETTKSLNTPWIRWIHPCSYLDRLKPFMASPGPDLSHHLPSRVWRPRDTPYHLDTLQYVPRTHGFLPKLSRYKERLVSILGPQSHITRHITVLRPHPQQDIFSFLFSPRKTSFSLSKFFPFLF